MFGKVDVGTVFYIFNFAQYVYSGLSDLSVPKQGLLYNMKLGKTVITFKLYWSRSIKAEIRFAAPEDYTCIALYNQKKIAWKRISWF